MKPTFTDEQTFRQRVSIFDEIGGGPLAVGASHEIATQPAATDKMDALLAGIKWIFLFLPGATAIHFCMMILSMSQAMGVQPSDIVFEALLAFLIYTFMVLFGIGRLSDMRYLKVVGAIIATSIMSSIVYHILAAFFIGYGGFGWAIIISLPLPILFAHMIKRRIDQNQPV